MLWTLPKLQLIRAAAAARRAAAAGLLGLGVFAFLFATNNSASASVVFDTQANLNWGAAPGSVVDYGVWVVPDGASASGAPTLRVASTSATVSVPFGAAVQILVAAYYPDDVVGPFSTPSETLYFRAPVPAPFDMDGDGRTDRLVRDIHKGNIRANLIDGTSTASEADILNPNPRNLRVSGSADFDGDGNADIVMWDSVLGAAELWLMDGEVVRSKLPIATLGAGWFARALGDINADGTARLFWRDPKTGESQLWSMRNQQVVAQQPLLDMPSNWEVWLNCDIDGNGSRDLIWIDQDATAARVWLFDASGAVDEVGLHHYGSRWRPEACGDFDRNGLDSIVWQAGKKLRIWSFNNMNAEGTRATGDSTGHTAPSRQRVAQAGDFDGDGDADLMFATRSNESTTTQLLEAGAVTSQHQSPIAPDGNWMISSW